MILGKTKHANRLKVLQNLRETAQRLEKVYFYGMKRTVRTIVRLSVQISGLHDKIIICRDYRQAVSFANQDIVVQGDGALLPLYSPEEVRGLIGIIGQIVWKRDYAVTIPELPSNHPLSELYNALDVMRYDLQSLEEQNKKTLELLKRSDQVKTDFMARMSHEIRTPLGGIIGAVDLLEKTECSSKQADLIRVLKSSASALLGEVSDILDLSRLEQGALRLVQATVNLRGLCQDAAEIVRPLCQMKKLDLVVSVDAAICHSVRTDPIHLRQVLINLLHNAVKFTSTGRIWLDCHLEEVPANSTEPACLCRFAVSDTGCGIPREKQSKIFERFSQVRESDSRVLGGSGLGLTISADLVKLLGGKLEVESQPGEGSCFFFVLSLPLASVPSPEDDISPLAPSDPHFTGKVLVVEDDEANRFILSSLLRNIGCTVSVAGDGIEGLNAAINEPFDLIFMDSQMPKMSGQQVVSRIRSRDDAIGDVPVVLVSAYNRSQSTMILSDQGFDAYLPKPVRLKDLFPVLDLFLTRSSSNTVRIQNDSTFALLEKRLTEIPGELNQLRNLLISASDAQGMEYLSHRIKGFLRTFASHIRNSELSRLAENLDRLIREQNYTESKKVIGEITAEISFYTRG